MFLNETCIKDTFLIFHLHVVILYGSNDTENITNIIFDLTEKCDRL